MSIRNIIKSNAYNYYKKLEIQYHRLLYLFLEITRKCNLNCLHCGSDCKADFQSPELTTDSWLKIIYYMCVHYSNDLTFVITGGEPLIHKDLLTITKHIQKKGYRWGMVSNGMVLNSERFKLLTESGLYSITISLDGLENSHNKLRNSKISYQRVLNALDIIGKSNFQYKDVITCVYPDNLYELDKIAKILIEKGITSWRLFRIFPSGRAQNNPITQLTFEQTQIMLNWIKNNKPKLKKLGLNLNLSCEGWVPYNNDIKLRVDAFFCRAGINIASVLSDGNNTGCSNNDKSFYTGNILTDDFTHVREYKFDEFRTKTWLKNTECNKCEHIKQCKGSSIHLWNLGDEKPKFCYVKDIG